MTLENDPRFAAALEECLRRVQHGEVLEACLADYPAEFRGELARLVPLAGRLGRIAGDPSPDTQTRLEARFLAAVDQERRARRTGHLGSLGRLFAAATMRLAVIALVALVVVVGTGVVTASADSLPDSPLYQVKEAREWVEFKLARDEEARADVQTRQVQERNRELERALGAGKAPRVAEALANRLSIAADRMVDQALQMRARGRPQATIRALVNIRAALRQIDRVEPRAAPAVRPALQQLRASLQQQERRLLDLRPAARP